MSIYYTPNEDPVFESLKTIVVDESTLEPLLPQIASGPKLFGPDNGMYGKSHKESTKKLMSDYASRTTVVQDADGNKFKTDINDPRLLSGELVGIAKGKVAVKDSSGNNFLVNKDDPRYLSGELVGVNKNRKFKQKVPSPHKGTFLAKNREGLMVRLTKLDSRYISGEFIHFRKSF